MRPGFDQGQIALIETAFEQRPGTNPVPGPSSNRAESGSISDVISSARAALEGKMADTRLGATTQERINVKTSDIDLFSSLT